MEYLKVKNWEKYQHYKNRTPPWIKLHRDLLRDYDFLRLQDASKLHLVLIWLLASQMDNRIPYDNDFIKKQIDVNDDINFKELIDNGFLEIDSRMLASCKQSATPETETETETETDSNAKIIAKMSDMFLKTLNGHVNLIQNLSSKGKDNLIDTFRGVLRSDYDLWQITLDKLKTDKFYLGENDRKWIVTLEWLADDKNTVKILNLPDNKKKGMGSWKTVR